MTTGFFVMSGALLLYWGIFMLDSRLKEIRDALRLLREKKEKP